MKKLLSNSIVKNTILLSILLIIVDIIFRGIVGYEVFVPIFLRIILSDFLLSLFLSVISSFFKKEIWVKIWNSWWLFLFSFYSIMQLGFESYIGIFMSFKTSSQLGAVTSYIKDYFASFSLKFYLVFLPFLCYVIYCTVSFFYKKKKQKKLKETVVETKKKLSKKKQKEIELALIKERKKRWLERAISVCVLFFGFVMYYVSLRLSWMQNELSLESALVQFKTASNPSISIYEFGPTVFAMIDIKTTLFPVEEDYIVETFPVDSTSNSATPNSSDLQREIDDSFWIQLNENTTNSNYKKLNNYFMNRNITPKNEYTGLFKGKNLIVIMMESTNEIITEHPEYFPTFNKLYTEGFHWTNSYSPRNNCSTGNNEMTGMTSLFTINNTCTAREYKKNVYAESIFGLFNKANYTTTSYHNYTEQYYPRSVIHKNMGSGKYYGVDDLKIKWESAYEEWPSDVLLMEKSFEIFKQKTPFFAWITSVTAHQPYYQSSTEGDRYLDLFKDTNYSSSLKRYLSKLKVFDNALARLMQLLEEEGMLKDTVFVLYGDHYPYGLNNSTIQKAVSYDVSKNNDIDKTPFVIYNSEIEGKEFNEYTSFMNIVPTIANLFDLDYDPRLYMGTDLLSETYENRVVFADGSWQTPIAFYNAGSAKIHYFTEDKYTSDEIKAINADVKNRINMSNLAIKTNYFKYLNEGIDSYKNAVSEEKGEE